MRSKAALEVDPRLHTSPRDMAAAARALLTQHDAGALPWLREIDVPVLILVGSEDRPNLSAADLHGQYDPGRDQGRHSARQSCRQHPQARPGQRRHSRFLRRLPP